MTDYLLAQTSTTTLSGHDRRDFWREHVRLNQGSLDFDFTRAGRGLDGGFDGSTIVQRCGEHQLIEFWSDPVAYTRSTRHARAEDDRSLRLVVPRTGSVTIEQATGEVVEVHAAWAAVVSMTAAFTVRHDETTRAWILDVPEGEWWHRFPPTRTAVLDLRTGAGRVSRTMIDALSEQRDALSGPEFEAVSARVCDLLSLCAGRGSTGRLATIERAARELVRTHCDDPALTPASLAERLGWSLRQVQTALAEAGTTPAALIRGARLARARARLTADADGALSIGEIAHRSGFGSLSGFNAAFRQEYAASPRDVRSAAGR